MDFYAKITKKWNEKKFVCVGLDPEFSKIPQIIKDEKKNVSDIVFSFNTEIIDKTHDLVAAYKPNTAFYEAKGTEGIDALIRTVQYIENKYSETPVILDAKRADIENTNNGYVDFAFEIIHSDAITLHPYLGGGALEPFLKRQDKGIFILARTSNQSASEFQDILINGTPFYQIVAEYAVKKWNKYNNIGLVMGATIPAEIEKIRIMSSDVVLLIPGVGAQGGDLEKTVKAARHKFIINSSRGIIFASNEENFAEAARIETEKIHNRINEIVVTL